MEKKKKIFRPKGKNMLTHTIEQVMKDYGGSRYRSTTLSNFKNDLAGRLEAAQLTERNAAVRDHIKEVAAKIASSKNIEKSLLYLNDTLFSYFEDQV